VMERIVELCCLLELLREAAWLALELGLPLELRIELCLLWHGRLGHGDLDAASLADKVIHTCLVELDLLNDIL